MIQVDAVGTLLHGAQAILAVGDHKQLPPFTRFLSTCITRFRCNCRWRGAGKVGYDVSLMERMITEGALMMKPSMIRACVKEHALASCCKSSTECTLLCVPQSPVAFMATSSPRLTSYRCVTSALTPILRLLALQHHARKPSHSFGSTTRGQK